MSTATKQRAPAVFIPHGGGPMPLLNEPSQQAIADFLRTLPQHYERPKAILVISAHWEAPRPTLLGAEHPPLLFDYYGFPPETYDYQYPATNPGELRTRVKACLEEAGLPLDSDGSRGYDHGVFVPLILMHPEADIPVLQLSLIDSLDPQAHIALGKALSVLRDDGVMILGSGFSFHNMSVMRNGNEQARAINREFHDWLADTLTNPDLTPEQRIGKMVDWDQAPGARFSHPREEHLLPLPVCLGAAGGQVGEILFDDTVLGYRTFCVIWRD
ncbi:DODA-type extradiol aromatic ring-opening family dioxygenase [Saccharospirillum impatiens]|uniref:DODA-type extradiol aromatic ring-opening family dioxygenase n=1 Tax=Saccharospirillum impatiens TaxID=169438 RepID=UPI000420DAF5|nr:class III extradiol ring-cleavage dioxygenase [Saccharospirillum impatiens]